MYTLTNPAASQTQFCWFRLPTGSQTRARSTARATLVPRVGCLPWRNNNQQPCRRQAVRFGQLHTCGSLASQMQTTNQQQRATSSRCLYGLPQVRTKQPIQKKHFGCLTWRLPTGEQLLDGDHNDKRGKTHRNRTTKKGRKNTPCHPTRAVPFLEPTKRQEQDQINHLTSTRSWKPGVGGRSSPQSPSAPHTATMYLVPWRRGAAGWSTASGALGSRASNCTFVGSGGWWWWFGASGASRLATETKQRDRQRGRERQIEIKKRYTINIYGV